MLRETIREDGLRIITKKLPWTKRFRLCFIVGAGSASDPLGQEGLFHLLEHMLLRGTKKHSFIDIWGTMDKFLRANAETAKTYTNFFAESVYPHFQTACELFGDFYLHSVFPEDAIIKEKESINNEFREINDTDGDRVDIELSKLLWGNTSRGRSGVGTRSSLKKINRDLLIKTYRENYVPSNTVILGIGKIEHEALASYFFDTLPACFRKTKIPVLTDRFTGLPLRKNKIITKHNGGQATIALGARIPPFDDRGRAVLTLLTSSLKFMLFQELRLDNSLCYSVESFFIGSRRLGHYFSFPFVTLPIKIEEATRRALKILCEMPLKRNIFEMQKEAVDSQILVSLESLSDWEDTILDRILDEKRKISFLDNYIKKQRAINNKISFEEVVNVRSELLRPERLACVIIRPH